MTSVFEKREESSVVGVHYGRITGNEVRRRVGAVGRQ